MKTTFKFIAVLTVLSLSLAPSLVRAQDEPPPPDDQYQGDQGASFQTFYDQLSNQGTWVQTDDYGYVFQPNVTDPDWAPYTDGQWVYTDEGWMWVSDEPWGWATYHYGRWANIDGMGWVWVPGYRWAPAWVSWRYGGGYCGWAPLPPETFIGVDYSSAGGFHFGGDVDVSFGIGAGWYNFVRVGDMGDRNYRGHFIDRSNNFTIINNTTNVTNININRNGGGAGSFGGVSVGGPRINDVNARAQGRIPTVQLTASNQPGRSRLEGNSLAVYAPAVNPSTLHQARPANVSRNITHPTLNRGDSITRPLDVTASVRPPAPTSEAIQAAQTAQLHAPANAKIATEKTAVRTPLNKPLTSLQPVTEGRHATTSGANAVNSNTERSTATAPFTGEPVKPAPTYHPQTENPGGQTYHPSSAPPAQTYHPQTENPGGQTYHPSSAPPAQTYHPQTENPGGQTYHPSSAPPAQTYHPQTENPGGQTYHPSSAPPAQTYHPQSQGNGGGAPAHTESAPVHSAPAGGQGGKPTGGPADNKNNPQGH